MGVPLNHPFLDGMFPYNSSIWGTTILGNLHIGFAPFFLVGAVRQTHMIHSLSQWLGGFRPQMFHEKHRKTTPNPVGK